MRLIPLLLAAATLLAFTAPVAAHTPSRLLGTPFAVDNSCSPFCHTGVCWYGQLQPGYWECYGTWDNGPINCTYGHWYWNVDNGAYYFWCEA